MSDEIQPDKRQVFFEDAEHGIKGVFQVDYGEDGSISLSLNIGDDEQPEEEAGEELKEWKSDNGKPESTGA